jgi:Na+/proline symporter
VVAVSLVLTVVSAGVPVAHAVELTFAVAASTFCPMLLLGIWWRGLTARGAIAGIVVGGGLAMGAVVSTTFGIVTGGWFGVVMTQPAAVSVPLSFATMVLVSIATRASAPEHVAQTMVRLHAPEHIDLNRGSFHPERWDGRPSATTSPASPATATEGTGSGAQHTAYGSTDATARRSEQTARRD